MQTIQSDLSIAAAAMPVGKTKVLLQFNKLTGALVSTLTYVDPETLNNEFFLYVEEEMDFNEDIVTGKYPDYKIVHRDEMKPMVTEANMDFTVQEKITKVYPAIKQINIVSDAITQLAKALIESKVVETKGELHEAIAALEEMRGYINEVRKANEIRKEYYKDNPDFTYISKEDQERELEEQLEGGLHEVYGGRSVKGGRVF